MNPISFTPLYMERVWGGRELENIYNRTLPTPETPYGESWEISDRPNEQSIANNGPHAGKTINELWQNQRAELFGNNLHSDRFPLLIKILDSRTPLSIQVHPPSEIAEQLGGEPKTEMWYIAEADPEAKLFVGLKNGTTRASFESSLTNGTCADQVHAISPKKGESIFIPSGRLHAIGAGLLIFEIQQNSDTTYRVFDWNRLGLDGKPRDLHVSESLQCIDFTDQEPQMDTPVGNTIAQCEHFQVDKLDLKQGTAIGNPDPRRFSILTITSGSLTDQAGNTYHPGQFTLMPVGCHPLTATANATVLQTTIPQD